MKDKLLEEIANQIKSCEKCELYKLRKNAVPGEGNPNSKIMLIGLGPGKEEDKQGRPFVGKAGKFLDELLSIVGIKREEVFITNIVKCIPPNNMPSENSIRICTSLYLNKQIDIINPKIIITLGEVATKYILEKFGLKYNGMNKEHGKIYNIKSLKYNLKIICMFHPASALYNPQLKEIIINDWKKIKDELWKEEN